MSSNNSGDDLVKVDFEIFGRVQGVFFRMHTQKQGQALGLRGFCRNTHGGTVSGTIEGPKSKIEQMKRWLQTVGSPQSRIDKAVFTGEAYIKNYSFKETFGIERTT